jgi:hypothetical protein
MKERECLVGFVWDSAVASKRSASLSGCFSVSELGEGREADLGRQKPLKPVSPTWRNHVFVLARLKASVANGKGGHRVWNDMEMVFESVS